MRFWKYWPSILLLAFLVFWTLVFTYSSPEKIIGWLGVENAYGLIFILAILGGLTTFSGVPYHLVLVTLATGGLNPLILGSVTAAGVMLGDTTSYYIGYHGRRIVPDSIQKILARLCAWCLLRPRILPVFFFLYGALVPFSNDFIVISMGFAHYPFWRVMLPLGLGNLVFNISLAFLAVYAYGFLRGVLP